MKNVKQNSSINAVLLTVFLGLILCLFIKGGPDKFNLLPKANNSGFNENLISVHQLLKKERLHETQQTNYNLSEKHKFIPSIKLNSYQALVYRKVDKVKTKLLQSILSNAKQKSKFKYIMKTAEELKLPNELALIPVIESEYKNNAVSPKGAGGLWQLMPGTAKIFGLSKQQRFETTASTKAALRHFKDLYNEYGNWELAIAAYNAGDGTVNKALRKNPHAKTVQDLSLPRETRSYVLAFFQLQKALKSYDLT